MNLLFLFFSVNKLQKKSYFSATFLKSWLNISDNISGVVGGHSSTRGSVGIGEKKGIFFLVE